MINLTIPQKCLSAERCFQICKDNYFMESYYFVWFFVIAFVFNNLSTIVYQLKDIEGLDPEMQYKLASGFKIASYLLNLAGIITFIFIV
jgi:hypothetical protein